AAARASLFALVLGSAASFGVHRFRFFGREAISFLLVLPIALPGIVTGMALNSYFTFWKFNFGLWTIVIGHATFCVVVVYNNVVARLRRVPGSLTEASMDLGADGWQTFPFVPLPTISTALVAGGLDRQAPAPGLARLDAGRARGDPAQAGRPARRERGGAGADRVAQRRQAARLRARRDARLLGQPALLRGCCATARGQEHGRV